MASARPPIATLILLAALALLTLTPARPAGAQAIDPEGRLVREVRFEGLVNTPEQLVRNVVRTEVGEPYRAQTVSRDIVRLTFLGRFDTAEAKVEPNNDGSIDVIFELVEQPTLASLQIEGNARIETEELEALVLLNQGDPIDRSLIDRGARAIERAYADKGYFAASVSVDEKKLEDERVLVYKVTEGPRVRIQEIRFEGNRVFSDDELYGEVTSEEQWWPFLAGFLDRDQLDRDAAQVRQYYLERGYLEAQVGRRIELSPTQTRAVVTFNVREGEQKTVRDIKVRFTKDGQVTDDQLMSAQQVRYVMELMRGSVYTERRLERSREALEYWYGEIGFINTDVRINRVFDTDQPRVDVVVTIEEGTGPTVVGDVTVIGLTRTQQKVLLRRVRGLEPGRPVNRRGLDETRELVKQSTWFSDGTVTPLGDPDDPIRDFLIEANEKNTGTFRIGAGVSSDSGLFGTISVEQRNFDIADWPESTDEFLAQRAFLGAGQTFNITLAPGNEISNYSIGFREPNLLESDYFFDFGAGLFTSIREDFDEDRFSVRTGLGRRLGDIWTGAARVEVGAVEISDIDASAPTDVFNVAGENNFTNLSLSLIRSTTDSNISPGRGTRLRLGVEQFGAFGGDFDFTRFTFGYDQFWTLDEDFLGRKTILSLRLDGGYIPQDPEDTPLFERFYAGGRDFRGFAFRGVGPRGIRNDTMTLGDDPIGGQFEFIARLQYEFPVYQNLIRWAVFTDQGTVQEDPGLDKWRAAVGTGIRLSLPFFSQAPIAIDVAAPFAEEAGDDTQLVSFSFELPFN